MKTLSLSLAAFAAIACLSPAKATEAPALEIRVSPINCDALGGDSRVCVVNKTRSSITMLQCNGHLFGTVQISVPGGRIPSGGIGIVDFNKGSCGTGIYVRTSDGQMHQIPGQDVDKTTILMIESETW